MATDAPTAPVHVPVSGRPGGNTPSTFRQILRLSRYQFRDYLRSRRFLLAMSIVLVIGFLLTVVLYHFQPAGLIHDPLAFYGSLWGGGATFVVIVAAVIYGGDAIAGEFQNKTGYFLMGLPIRRSAVYVAKFIAAFLAALAAVLLYLVILLLNGAYYLGGGLFPWQLGESLVLAIVYLLAVLGAALMFSSLFKTSAYATLLVAVLFLFGFTILQDVIQGLANITPWMVITYADTIIGGIFSTNCSTEPGMHTCTLADTPSGPIVATVNNASIPEGVGIMLAYFVICAVVGLLFFERGQFT